MGDVVKGGAIPNPGPVLSTDMVSDLDDIHDTEIPGLLHYINYAVKDLRQMAAFAEVKKSPGAIQKELDKARSVLDGLSPYAKMHISKQLKKTDIGSACQAAVSVALSIPYEQENTHPDREKASQHARHIDTHFIQAQDVVDTKVILEGLVQFLIDTTGVKGTARTVADKARAENIELANEQAFLDRWEPRN